MQIVANVCEFLACLFIGLLGFFIVFKIATGAIDLKYLLSETNGHASMARFQFLVFTFVVAISMYKMIERDNKFPEVPTSVLTLLGISASTYAVGKSIQFSDPAGLRPPADEPGDHGENGGGRGHKAHVRKPEEEGD